MTREQAIDGGVQHWKVAKLKYVPRVLSDNAAPIALLDVIGFDSTHPPVIIDVPLRWQRAAAPTKPVPKAAPAKPGPKAAGKGGGRAGRGRSRGRGRGRGRAHDHSVDAAAGAGAVSEAVPGDVVEGVGAAADATIIDHAAQDDDASSINSDVPPAVGEDALPSDEALEHGLEALLAECERDLASAADELTAVEPPSVPILETPGAPAAAKKQKRVSCWQDKSDGNGYVTALVRTHRQTDMHTHEFTCCK